MVKTNKLIQQEIETNAKGRNRQNILYILYVVNTKQSKVFEQIYVHKSLMISLALLTASGRTKHKTTKLTF